MSKRLPFVTAAIIVLTILQRTVATTTPTAKCIKCTNGGACNSVTNKCDCPKGYTGAHCNICSSFKTRGRLDFSSVGHSNLGGLGPDQGKEELVFTNVGYLTDTRSLDLHISAISTEADAYVSFHTEKNGPATSQLGQINLGVQVTEQNKGRIDTIFNFSFVDHDTQKPVMLEYLTMGVFDIDHDINLVSRETVCVEIDELYLQDSTFPGTKVNYTAGNPTIHMTPKVYPDAGLIPGYREEQILSTYHKDRKCSGSTNTKMGSIRLRSNFPGFECDNPTFAFEEKTEPMSCVKCFGSEKCKLEKWSKPFGPIYGQGSNKGKTCAVLTDPDCTAQHGIDQEDRSFNMAFKQRSSFHLCYGLECNKAVGQTCTRNFLFGALTTSCVLCPHGTVPDGKGLCEATTTSTTTTATTTTTTASTTTSTTTTSTTQLLSVNPILRNIVTVDINSMVKIMLVVFPLILLVVTIIVLICCCCRCFCFARSKRGFCFRK